MPDVSVRLATAGDRPVVERLWLMFRHDLSGFRGVLPNPDGTFRGDRVEAAFARDGWAPYLFLRDDRPVGLAGPRPLSMWSAGGAPGRGLAGHVRRGGTSGERRPSPEAVGEEWSSPARRSVNRYRGTPLLPSRGARRIAARHRRLSRHRRTRTTAPTKATSRTTGPGSAADGLPPDLGRGRAAPRIRSATARRTGAAGRRVTPSPGPVLRPAATTRINPASASAHRRHSATCPSAATTSAVRVSRPPSRARVARRSGGT
ncbi:hypothetical protein ABT052_14060 [Streptomyces sp. NPDC002766]|uniref:hypothetical protein n=1 Tax=Streptomyces sp. NPDC002766 TaxID=3154429 RepID=UPI00332AD8D8